MLRMPVLDQADYASKLARLARVPRAQSFRSGWTRSRGNLKTSRRITHRNSPPPGSGPKAASEWPLKIDIRFDESADVEGTEVTIRYASPGFARGMRWPEWEKELDPLESPMVPAWGAFDIDFRS